MYLQALRQHGMVCRLDPSMKLRPPPRRQCAVRCNAGPCHVYRQKSGRVELGARGAVTEVAGSNTSGATVAELDGGAGGPEVCVSGQGFLYLRRRGVQFLKGKLDGFDLIFAAVLSGQGE